MFGVILDIHYKFGCFPKLWNIDGEQKYKQGFFVKPTLIYNQSFLFNVIYQWGSFFTMLTDNKICWRRVG